MNVYAIYRGSDGGATTRLYHALTKRGSLGVIAKLLFRAQKASKRAKKYGFFAGINGRTYRDMSYQKKEDSLRDLCRALVQHAGRYGIRWGWGKDNRMRDTPFVLYVELPDHGQVSFHSPVRHTGPWYKGKWDGKRGMSEPRTLRFTQQVYTEGVNYALELARRTVQPAETQPAKQPS